MACSRCGDICHCYAGVRTPNVSQTRPRFELDSEDLPSSLLVDPEQYEATEEQFSVSLEAPAGGTARFIPDKPAEEEQSAPAISVPPPLRAQHFPVVQQNSSEQAPPPTAISPDGPLPIADAVVPPSEPSHHRNSPEVHFSSSPGAWKEELAARLSSYRAKRKPRPPKYPSLSLDFDPPFPAASSSRARTSDLRTALAIEDRQQKISTDAPAQNVRLVPAEEVTPPPTAPAASGRLIEFPRFFGPEEVSPDQLAEPICEQPRILDAPEVELPAPALGGIVLETNEEPETEERPGFEVPLRSASISRRIFAAAIDAIVIISAEVLFAYIFLQLAKVLPALPKLLASAALVGGVLWAGYQYLLLTYSGSTPGLRLAKLQLTHFDGSSVLRSRRRWRVLASFLSGVSLGLGFAWCFLDEDSLCWHDRITRTHLMPRD